jgi:hypothetical protein
MTIIRNPIDWVVRKTLAIAITSVTDVLLLQFGLLHTSTRLDTCAVNIGL